MQSIPKKGDSNGQQKHEMNNLEDTNSKKMKYLFRFNKIIQNTFKHYL